MEVEFDGFPGYEVSNFAESSFGVQTVLEATLTSTNVVFAQLAAEVGPDAVREMAVRAGIPDDSEAVPAVPSLVLGTADVRAVDMASAFATFAAEGVRHEPRLNRKVVDRRTGEVLLDDTPEGERAVDANVANIVTDILVQNVERGTGTAARIGRPAAGKTGTTNDSRDAWFVGYVPRYATAVWIGTLDNSPMDNVVGGSIPAETWGLYMQQAVAPLAVEEFPVADYSGLLSLHADLGVPTTPASPTTEPTPTDSPTGPSPTAQPSPESSPAPSPTGEPSEPASQEPSEQPSGEPDPGASGGDPSEQQ